MSGYKFPKIAGAVRWQGAVVRLTYGQVWPADDPLVQARPDLFATEPHELTTSPRTPDQAPQQTTVKSPTPRRAAAKDKTKS